MSRFFSEKYLDLEPYVPGELPKTRKQIKLNTNENPYPPHPAVAKAAEEAAKSLQLYSDTESTSLRAALAKRLNVSMDELIITNGSDEVLNFAFLAFCDEHIPAVFPDITYGFYPVFAKINMIPYREIPLRDFHIRHDYTFLWRKDSIFSEEIRRICLELRSPGE